MKEGDPAVCVVCRPDIFCGPTVKNGSVCGFNILDTRSWQRGIFHVVRFCGIEKRKRVTVLIIRQVDVLARNNELFHWGRGVHGYGSGVCLRSFTAIARHLVDQTSPRSQTAH